jgi:hypothetical protein
MAKKPRKLNNGGKALENAIEGTRQPVDLKSESTDDTTTEVITPIEEVPAGEQIVEPMPARIEPLSPEAIITNDEKPVNTRQLGRQAWITAGKPKMSDFEIVYGTRKLSWIRIVAEGIKPAPEDFRATLVTKQAVKATG